MAITGQMGLVRLDWLCKCTVAAVLHANASGDPWSAMAGIAAAVSSLTLPYFVPPTGRAHAAQWEIFLQMTN